MTNSFSISLVNGPIAQGRAFTSGLRVAVARKLARRRTRRALQHLSDAQLDDIGADKPSIRADGSSVEVRLEAYLKSLR